MKPDRAPRRVPDLAIFGLIAVITALAFWRVTSCDYVNFDDDLYVTDNANVKAGITAQGLTWAFTTLHSFNWHPLTWLSHMADCQLFGVNAGAHHLMSLLFHIVNSVLVFVVFSRATGARWRSAIVAALFAVHPLHVESVAWIAERKDVLSGMFWLLTTWAYVEYARRRNGPAYGMAVACYALGVLSKPMVVTLPFVLLLMDVWPLRRLRVAGAAGAMAEAVSAARPEKREKSKARDERSREHGTGVRDPGERSKAAGATFGRRPLSALLVEKIPFFALMALSAVMTYIAQHRGGAVASISLIPIQQRIANAFISYLAYLEKMFWPTGLCVLYPIKPSLPAATVAGSLALLIAVSVLVVTQWRKRPYLGVGWLWFLGTMVPVIGLIQVGSQSMADRYMYIPSLGASIVLVWGLGEIVARMKIAPAVVGGVTTVVVIALAARTQDQVRYWKDSVAMYARALAVTTDNPTMEKNFGVTLMRLGRLDEAKRHLDEAIRVEPRFADAYFNRGVLGDNRNDPVNAEADYRKAIGLKPDFTDAHERLGVLLFNHARIAEAADELETTARLKPANAQVRTNYGAALELLGRYPEAAEQFRRALAIQPDYADAQAHLGRVEAMMKGSAKGP